MLYQLSYARNFVPITDTLAVRHPASAVTPPSVARRSRLRWLLWPMIGIAGVVGIVRSDAASDTVCRLVEATIEGLTGERATIAHLALGLRSVSLVGIDIVHPATNESIVHADAVTMLFGWDNDSGPLPGLGRPVLRRLILLGPDVSLHLDPDGLREFRDPTKLFASDAPADPVTEFPWRELEIVSGRFVIRGVNGPKTLWSARVDGIDLTPGRPGLADLVLNEVAIESDALRVKDTNIVFRQLAVTPDRLVLPDVHLRFAAGTAAPPLLLVDGSLDAWLGRSLAGGVSVQLDLPALTPGLPSYNRPVAGWTDGVLHLDATFDGSPNAPDIHGLLAMNGLTLHNGPPQRFGDIHGPWHLDLKGEAPQFVLDAVQMEWGPGTVGVDARVNLVNGAIDASVAAESVSLAGILSDVAVAPTPWVDFRADVDTTVHGALSPFRLEGPFEIALTNLEVGDAPLGGPHSTLLSVPKGSLVGDLVITADHMIMDVAQLKAGPTHGRALADIGFAEHGPLRVDVDLPTLDLSWLAPLNDLGLDGLAEIRGTIEGPYEALSADGTLSGKGVVVLGLPIADSMTAHFSSDMKRLDFDEVRGLVGETLYEGDFGIDFEHDEHIRTMFRITDGHARDLTGMFVDLGEFDAGVTGGLTLDGTPYNLNGIASFNLGPGSMWGEPFSSGSAEGKMVDGEFTLTDLRVLRPGSGATKELLRARGSVKRGFAMNLELLSDGLAIERLAHAQGIGLTGDLQVDAQVGGTLYDWEPRGRIALRHVHVFGEPVADTTFRFKTTHNAEGNDTLAWNGEVFGGAGSVEGTFGLAGDQPYAMHVDFTDFPLAFFHPRAPDGTPIEAGLTGTLDLAGKLGDHPTPADIDGTLQAVHLRWGTQVLGNEAPWSFSLHNREFIVPALTLTGNDGTRFEFEGHAAPGDSQAGDLPPVQFEGTGKIDLDLLRAVVPEVREAHGMAQVDLHIDSAAKDPVRISARLRDATFRTGYFPATFENVKADLTADADGYSLDNVSASVGGGTFAGAPSTIDADNWVPKRYALKGQLRDAKVQYIDYLPPMRGDASLTFDGPVGDLLLGGSIAITDMEWRERIDWESTVVSLREERLTAAAPDPSANYFGMDLTVTAANTLRLRNNVADADASCTLRVIGDTSRPGMVGTILLAPGGQLYLNDREFDIKRGEIRYIDPYTFDPDVDLLLETDVRSQEQDYHLTYMVNGPFSDWRTTTSSDPYLSQADINALLLFGVTREELERYGGLGTALLAETGDLLLGQTALSRTNFLVVDRWNLVSGVTERGTPTLSSDLRLVAQKEIGGFDVTMETALGQNLGRDWYMSVERRIAQRLYASAWLATEQEGRTLPIGAAYGLDLKLRVEGD